MKETNNEPQVTDKFLKDIFTHEDVHYYNNSGYLNASFKRKRETEANSVMVLFSGVTGKHSDYNCLVYYKAVYDIIEKIATGLITGRGQLKSYLIPVFTGTELTEDEWQLNFDLMVFINFAKRHKHLSFYVLDPSSFIFMTPEKFKSIAELFYPNRHLNNLIFPISFKSYFEEISASEK